ncbi:hypothetical protein GQ607_011339 [Colletotrichum asianum]|uniref:Uncharacterized protein n=1 Tax=Colletotrichum asianum TaxID=702518 RepID=A0A8H3W8X3_9PEZI|nr:hypothetical protein GQ607_011339 [Colletotrichum asianum]
MRLLPCSSHVVQPGPAILVAFAMARLHLSPTISRPARSLSTPTFLARPRMYSAALSVLIDHFHFHFPVDGPSPKPRPQDLSLQYHSLSYREACVWQGDSHFCAFIASRASMYFANTVTDP